MRSVARRRVQRALAVWQLGCMCSAFCACVLHSLSERFSLAAAAFEITVKREEFRSFQCRYGESRTAGGSTTSDWLSHFRARGLLKAVPPILRNAFWVLSIYSMF